MNKKLIDGYEKIENIYGYWPSFHDDIIEKVEISEEGITLIISFEKPPNNMNTDATIKLSFKEVEAFSLSGEILGSAGIIFDMNTNIVGELIETQLSSSLGVHGTILSKNIQIELYEQTE